LARWLTRQQQLGVFQGLCTRWVGQSAVRSDKLLALRIPLPSLAQQQRIITIIDKADHILWKRKDTIDAAEDLIRTEFATLFGDLTKSRKGYLIRTLSGVVRPGTEVTYGIVQCGPHVHDGVPYIRASDMTEHKLDITKMGRTAPDIARRFRRSEVQPGELVFSIRATVGAVHLVPPELDGANLTQGTARIAPGENVNPLFLLWALRSAPVQSWVGRQCKGTTFREITLGRLRQLPISLPPKAEQDRFARLATKWDEVITRMREAHLAALNLYRSLVQRAFRGEL
jgi:type I restriction enzyme S subunit